MRVSATLDNLRARWAEGRDVALDPAVEEVLSAKPDERLGALAFFPFGRDPV